MQMLFSCMVIYTIDPALENRKTPFNCVRANQHVALFASVNLPRVADSAVTTEMPAESAIDRIVVPE
jgi:hypothetical protein